jgi:hypothetical protein
VGHTRPPEHPFTRSEYEVLIADLHDVLPQTVEPLVLGRMEQFLRDVEKRGACFDSGTAADKETAHRLYGLVNVGPPLKCESVSLSTTSRAGPKRSHLRTSSAGRSWPRRAQHGADGGFGQAEVCNLAFRDHILDRACNLLECHIRTDTR